MNDQDSRGVEQARLFFLNRLHIQIDGFKIGLHDCRSLFHSLWETVFTILFFHSTKVPSSIFRLASSTNQR